jgi:hypothetical protein
MMSKAVISSCILTAVAVLLPSNPALAEDWYFKHHDGPCNAGYSYIASQNMCYCANCLLHAAPLGSRVSSKANKQNTHNKD